MSDGTWHSLVMVRGIVRQRCEGHGSNGVLQNWDINEELPAEVEGPFHVALSTNVLHTGNNLKSAPSSCTPLTCRIPWHEQRKTTFACLLLLKGNQTCMPAMQDLV